MSPLFRRKFPNGWWPVEHHYHPDFVAQHPAVNGTKEADQLTEALLPFMWIRLRRTTMDEIAQVNLTHER